MKYKHILFPTDGSKESLKAISHIKAISKVFDTKITLLCVYQTAYNFPVNYNSLPQEIFSQYQQDHKKQAEKIVRDVQTTFSSFGLDDVEWQVREGNSKKIICEFAKQCGCDLIIMGTRGYSELNYLGSTSAYVINHTPGIPVMVVD